MAQQAGCHPRSEVCYMAISAEDEYEILRWMIQRGAPYDISCLFTIAVAVKKWDEGEFKAFREDLKDSLTVPHLLSTPTRISYIFTDDDSIY
jgi:hypothetical protein